MNADRKFDRIRWVWAVLAIAALGVLGALIGAGGAAQAQPVQQDPCGGCPAGLICQLVVNGGVATWTCVWGQLPGPTATAPPGPTVLPGTPVPTTVPCIDGVYTIREYCVPSDCPEYYGRDITRIYDCVTGVLIAETVGPCYLCVVPPTPTPIPTPEPIPTIVCPVVYDDSGQAHYDPDCIAEVSVEIPAPAVTRLPYPRGLVSLDNLFTLGIPEARENWSDPPLPEGVPIATRQCGGVELHRYKNYQLGLQWVRIGTLSFDGIMGGAAPPGPWPPYDVYWEFGDGGASAGHRATRGTTASHVYKTSSYGRSPNGPGGLPSYQAQAHTYWALFWAVQYDERVCIRWEEVCGCGENATYHSNVCPDCASGQRWNARERCAECEWQHKFRGWYPVDLTQYGSLTWYHHSAKVSVPQQGIGIAWTIPVPIIESQGVIEK